MTVTMVGGDAPDLLVARFAPGRSDVAVVDALMRCKLVAQRQGRDLRVRHVPDDLRALLEFIGLAEVLDLRREPGGEPELLEQRGEDEVVQGGDPRA